MLISVLRKLDADVPWRTETDFQLGTFLRLKPKRFCSLLGYFCLWLPPPAASCQQGQRRQHVPRQIRQDNRSPAGPRAPAVSTWLNQRDHQRPAEPLHPPAHSAWSSCSITSTRTCTSPANASSKVELKVSISIHTGLAHSRSKPANPAGGGALNVPTLTQGWCPTIKGTAGQKRKRKVEL